MITLIAVIIIIALVALFSLQNAVPATISFLFWRFDASLALVIFLSTLLGFIAGMIVISLILRRMSGRGEGKQVKAP